MLYYYKRPGDWLWRRIETPSIAAAAHGHRLGANWRYRIAGESKDRTLSELIELERAAQAISGHTDRSLGPDATWGYIEAAICLSLIGVGLFIPARAGASPGSKYYLVVIGLFWLADGLRRIRLARAWRPRQLRQPKA